MSVAVGESEVIDSIAVAGDIHVIGIGAVMNEDCHILQLGSCCFPVKSSALLSVWYYLCGQESVDFCPCFSLDGCV